MKYLGMAAVVLTLLAIILNTIWFARHDLPLGRLLAVTWPSVLGLAVLLGLVMGLGYLAVRILHRDDGPPTGDDGPPAGEADPPQAQGPARPGAKDNRDRARKEP